MSILDELCARLRSLHLFERADRMSGAGEYAVLPIGWKDEGGEDCTCKVRQRKNKLAQRDTDPQCPVHGEKEARRRIDRLELERAARVALDWFANFGYEANDAKIGGRDVVGTLRAALDTVEGETWEPVHRRRVANLVTQLKDEIVIGGGFTETAAKVYDEINRELGTLADSCVRCGHNVDAHRFYDADYFYGECERCDCGGFRRSPNHAHDPEGDESDYGDGFVDGVAWAADQYDERAPFSWDDAVKASYEKSFVCERCGDSTSKDRWKGGPVLCRSCRPAPPKNSSDNE